MKTITKKTVTVKQGYKVVLEKQGFTRIIDSNKSVTVYYGKRQNGKRIYSVPVFTIYGEEIVGKSISVA